MSQAMWRGSGRLRRPENALAGDCRAAPRERPPALQSPEKGVARCNAQLAPDLDMALVMAIFYVTVY